MQNINLFIPNSFLAETNDLKLKTYKVGIIGRALAVFRVNKVIIYNDSSFNDERGSKDAKFIYDVLSYMNTPQYLRKRAFPIQEDLKHVKLTSVLSFYLCLATLQIPQLIFLWLPDKIPS